MPDDTLLGEFQEAFAGAAATIEEYPQEGSKLLENCYAASQVIGHKEMWEKLVDAAEDFYEHLAREVDIHCTDKDELAVIDHRDDGTLDVRIYLMKKTQKEKNPYFHRVFLPDETKEIRIYLYGGNVRTESFGHKISKIKVRVIGGEGSDTVDDSNGGGILANLIVPTAMRNLGLRFEIARDLLILSMGIVILSILPVIAVIDKLCCRIFNETGFIHPQDELYLIYSDLGKSNFRNAIQWIVSDKRIMRMAVIITMRGVAETVLVYLFYWLVTEQTPAANGRTLFFADFYILLNAGTLLILLMGTNRLIDRYGLVFSLAALPVALFLGSLYLILNTAMVVVYILRIVDRAVVQSFYFQGEDRLLLEVDESRAPYVRPILQGLAVRVGRGLGAALILILALGIGVSLFQMAAFMAVILLIWIAAVLSLRRFYRKTSSALPG